ncbi:MAG: hypothetical protein V2A73_11090 [Pseudomonadota bacterium]
MMRLAELAGLYLLIGSGCAAVLLLRQRTVRAFLDAALLLPFWPIIGPFLVLGATQPERHQAAPVDLGFLQAFERAARTPLGALLPGIDTIRKLADRLGVAAAKVAEIEGLLARPEFDEGEAVAHYRELEKRGASECALTSASLRIQNIRRLAALRDRFANELEDVRELLKQLQTQVEVVRFAGTADASTADLVQELLARVEGLDQVLDDDPREIHTMVADEPEECRRRREKRATGQLAAESPGCELESARPIGQDRLRR